MRISGDRIKKRKKENYEILDSENFLREYATISSPFDIHRFAWMHDRRASTIYIYRIIEFSAAALRVSLYSSDLHK